MDRGGGAGRLPIHSQQLKIEFALLVLSSRPPSVFTVTVTLQAIVQQTSRSITRVEYGATHTPLKP